MRIIQFTVFFVLICSVSPSFACKLVKTSSFYWNDETLVQKTPLILLVKLIQAEPIKDEINAYRPLFKYTFEVLEVVKGKYSKKQLIVQKDFIAPRSENNATTHSIEDFNGRSYYGKDCRLYESGELNRSYLYFFDTYHPKFFEKVDSKNDKWFKKVRELIKNNPLGNS